MPAKCDKCGAETEIAESFFKERKSFARQILTYCPTCRANQQQRTITRLFLSHFAFGGIGLLLVVMWPELGMGWTFLNLFIFQMLLSASILPHELGHAFTGRWLGLRVFKLYVGSGKTLFKAKLFGFPIEFRVVPLGGLAVVTHKTMDRFRLKHFAMVLAGPAVNCLLAAAVLPFIASDRLWTFEALRGALAPGLMFFYANLTIVIENLWPHNVTTPLGVFPSDGKQLWQTLRFTPECQEQNIAATFMLEAAESREAGDHEVALRWIEKGLNQFPDNEGLMSWQGIIQIDVKDYQGARECFIKLLDRESKQPLFRPLMMNNLAYVDALMEDPALLEEADRSSQAAMSAAGWVPAIKGTRGTVLAALGRVDEGLKLLQESMAQADNSKGKAENACLIAIIEAKRGNLVEAQKYIDDARELDPKCPLLAKAESYGLVPLS
jgi:tetratricopeptide (TPR) repeat protein/uncharacterized protein YlaI